MKHVTMIEDTPDGHLGRCETCGDRNDEYTGYGAAAKWCDEHEWYPRKRQRGARPGIKVLERQYREKSTNLVYTPEERALWLQLADELLAEMERKAALKAPIPGQMDLFPIPSEDPDEGESDE